MDKFIGFLQSNDGRVVRLMLGIVMIVFGAVAIEPPVSYVVMFVGLVPLAAGLMGICLVGPLFGYALTGERRVRHAR